MKRRDFLSAAFAAPLALFASAQEKAPESTVAGVSLDAEGRLIITYTDGRRVRPPLEERQLGFSEPAVAEDRRTVGWLVEYENRATTYAIPLLLIIFRSGGVLRRIGNGFVISGWYFANRGTQVAFNTNTVHGDIAPYYELRDVETDKIVDKWEGRLTPKAPDWAQRLGGQ